MKRRTGRWSAGVLAVLLTIGALVGAIAVGLSPAAAAATRPAQAATTVPAAGTAAATSVPAPAPPVDTAVPGSPTTAAASDQIGDPAADRRIRNIVLALGVLALIVLITTIIFWRKTRPVPVALDGLRRLGTRAGRQAAVAVEAAGVAPASVAGGGVARSGVSVRPAAAVAVVDAGAVAEGASVADGDGSAADAGGSVADGDGSAVDAGGSVADADVPVEGNGAPLAARPEAEPSAVERASSAAELEGPESIASAAVPPVDVVPASSDEPGPPPAVAGPPPAAEVVPASAPPPAPGTSLRDDG